MRKGFGLIVAVVLAVSGLIFTSVAAFADSPHFISEGTASITSTGAYNVANFKEAGLGNLGVTSISITLSATASATYACVNGGGNHPKATNKESVQQNVSSTGTFPIRNGSTTGSLSVGPPPAGPFTPPCSPPMQVVLISVSYTNVSLSGAGATSAEPNLSATFPL